MLFMYDIHSIVWLKVPILPHKHHPGQDGARRSILIERLRIEKGDVKYIYSDDLGFLMLDAKLLRMRSKLYEFVQIETLPAGKM